MLNALTYMLSAFLSFCLWQHEVNAGIYNKFRRWTNDTTEYVYHTESSCTRTKAEKNASCIENNSICAVNGRNLTLSAGNYQMIGLTSEQLEEWVWIDEAMRERQKAMTKSSAYLSKILYSIQHPDILKQRKDVQDDIARFKTNLIELAKLEYDLTKLKDNTPSSQDSCVIAYKHSEADCNRILGDAQNERIRILIAKDTLYKKAPLLAHDVFGNWIWKIKRRFKPDTNPNDSPVAFLAQNNDKIMADMKTAIKDAQTVVIAKNDEYEKILNTEKSLGEKVTRATDPGQKVESETEYKQTLDETLHNPELLEELLISTDPSQTKGLEFLKNAGCRLEQRVLVDKATGELRALAFNSVLVAGTTFIGGPALSRAAGALGKAVASNSSVVRPIAGVALAIGGTNGIFVAADYAQIVQVEHRCQTLRAFASSGINESIDGSSITRMLNDCTEELSTRKEMAGINAVAGVAMDVIAIKAGITAAKAAAAEASIASHLTERQYIEEVLRNSLKTDKEIEVITTSSSFFGGSVLRGKIVKVLARGGSNNIYLLEVEGSSEPGLGVQWHTSRIGLNDIQWVEANPAPLPILATEQPSPLSEVRSSTVPRQSETPKPTNPSSQTPREIPAVTSKPVPLFSPEQLEIYRTQKLQISPEGKQPFYGRMLMRDDKTPLIEHGNLQIAVVSPNGKTTGEIRELPISEAQKPRVIQEVRGSGGQNAIAGVSDTKTTQKPPLATDVMKSPVRDIEGITPEKLGGRDSGIINDIYYGHRDETLPGFPKDSELTRKYIEALKSPGEKRHFIQVAHQEGDEIARKLGLKILHPPDSDSHLGFYKYQSPSGEIRPLIRDQFSDGHWWFINYMKIPKKNVTTTYKVYLNLPPEKFSDDLGRILDEAKNGGAFCSKFGASTRDLARQDRFIVYFDDPKQAQAFAKKIDKYLSEKGYPPGQPDQTGRIGKHVGIGADHKFGNHVGSHRKRVSQATLEAARKCNKDPLCICLTFVAYKINPVNYLPLEMDPVDCN